jgi:FkbM family methyltransferase
MYYAEFETDKYIRENFFPDFQIKGIMAEIGAGPTEFYSMSKHFRDFGWRCVCVDPNPKFVNQHKSINNEIYQLAISNYNGKSNFNIVSSGWNEEYDGISYSGLEIKYKTPNNNIHNIEVEVSTLNSLLENLSVKNIDFLSVDVEGSELEVMEGFDLLFYKPKVVLLENYEHNDSYIEYMKSLGYILHNKIQYNYIFENNNK